MNIYDFCLEEIFKESKTLIDSFILNFKSSEKILRLSNDEFVQFLSEKRVKEDVIKEILEKKEEFNKEKKELIEEYYHHISQIKEIIGADIISFSDKEYPVQLKKIREIPLNLYVKGNLNFDYSKSIAIVGTRNVSAHAKDKVSEIAKELANKGFCIISGLARGVDGQAQSSVVAINKKTIAVLPFLSNRIYPSEHNQLARDILSNGGALVSENLFLNKQEYSPLLFTRRNRLISGLSKVVLIVEGSYKSGSLSQYYHAKRQGKIILTLKPIKDVEGAYLPKKIIKEGGIAIETASDIINIFNTKT